MLILYNARFYTMDEKTRQVEALALAHGRVINWGDFDEVYERYGLHARCLDLEGKVVIPGLTDAHIHLEHYALALQKVDCETSSRAECLRRVAQRARESEPGAWILGHGWNQNDWPEGFGDAAALDEVAPANPVYLTAKSLHAGWANSAALRQAKIFANMPDPPGGRIGRRSSGQPDGLLFERAMELIIQAIPGPTPETLENAIREALPRLWRMGLTGAHDFDRSVCFMALQNLHQSGELGLRVLKSLPVELLPQAVEVGLRSGFGDDFLRIGGVKLFADGALGPHTAAMLAPYEDDPNNTGMLLLDAEEIFEYGRQAAQNGLPLAVHAIGDRANHEVIKAYGQLRAFENAQLPTKDKALRHRIEHVQLLHPEDAPRLAQLDVIASMQPIHATSDMLMADRYWGARSELAYASAAQDGFGARLAFGSDAPVESPNPFWGLHAAVTRRRQDGPPGPDGWYPEQRLSVERALQGYTLGPAYAAGMEHRLGKLAPGYLADLLVLDVDPFGCPPDELYKIEPQATMIGGKWVYQAR